MVRISGLEEHTTRVQIGNETRRPIGTVTIEFNVESGARVVKERLKNSRGLNRLMDDGHSYRMRWQSDGYMWISVTYQIRPASANPYKAGTTDKLKERALKAVQEKIDTLLDRR